VRFPLKDVKVQQVSVVRSVTTPVYADNYWQMNQHEFAMQVEGVGEFYACDGQEVEYMPVSGADDDAVELYLNGSVYGAILHQRKILPIHGSCFRYKGMGIMICGDAGVGKSSVTASFCLNGAEFLTDDVTPVVFRDGIPYIWAMSDRIKLWDDTFEQFGIKRAGLPRVHPEVDKYYLPMTGEAGGSFRLDYIFILQNPHGQEVTFDELTATDKFAAVRSEIFRPEYLSGMPENIPVYFSQTVETCSNVRVFHVKRPANIMVSELHEAILDCFGGLEGES
jgi:hypothetical protein